ncbi:hypothetical protein Pla100_29150 [Neorhodopirellula pilleata]|uniref:Uncharacterized protein n=2 Tax=Neorhodopirellula pilleata TaxID=2714738 RepID=A0A5C6ABA3_9BACT|nr:hypothetical protein Pla100_29150 [Neorhodopirellula pilleata]
MRPDLKWTALLSPPGDAGRYPKEMNVRLEPLPYLPRKQDNVVNLDDGNGTTTSEGCVLRCWLDDTHCWIANAKPGNGYAMSITPWPYANAHIWIARGAVYLLRIDQAYSWTYYDDLGIACYIAHDPKHAFIATYTDVICLDSAGFIHWRTPVAIDGIEFLGETDGWLELNCCDDPPDVWRPRRVSIRDGAIG